MKKKRFEKKSIKLLKDIKEMTSKVGINLRLHGRQYIILATAAGMLLACTVALIGCSTPGSPPLYTAEEWEKQKFKSRSRGSR